MNKNIVFILIGVIGLIIGLFLSGTGQQGGAYCDSIEQQIQQNRSFNGSAACYPPGVLDVNVSDRIEENANIRCVCRIIDRSGTRIFPVAVSN